MTGMWCLREVGLLRPAVSRNVAADDCNAAPPLLESAIPWISDRDACVCVKNFAEGSELDSKAHFEADRGLSNMIRGPVSSLYLFCGPHTHAKVYYGQKQSDAVDAHASATGAFTTELIRLRGQGRGRTQGQSAGEQCRQPLRVVRRGLGNASTRPTGAGRWQPDSHRSSVRWPCT